MANNIIVGCWDCAYCGADRIRGDIRICPNCGKPRGSDVTFYMAGPKEYVKDPETVEKEPDWLCSYCDTLNPASSGTCSSCGASREDSELNYFQNKEKKEQREAEEKKRREQAQDSHVSVTRPSARTDSGHLRRNLFLAAALVAVIALIFSALPRNRKIHVDSRTWERTVTIDRYQKVQESGWEIPGGAEDVTSRQEIYGYDRVLDHYEWVTYEIAEQVPDGYDTYVTYEDLGNGYFEEVEHSTPRYRTEYRTETRQEPVYVDLPVYRTKYYYSIMRWKYDREETTWGANDEPYFAQPQLPDTERISGRTEQYWIISGNDRYSISYDLWQQVTTGSNIEVRTRDGRIEELK